MERSKVPFTNDHFAAYCRKMIGHPYWMGTCGYKATKSLLKAKTNQYPQHYSQSRMKRYYQDIENKEIVCDCIGGIKGYAWTGGGEAIISALNNDLSVSSIYASHGCPDYGSNTMYRWAKKKGAAWGAIDSLPEIPGIALYKDGHTGYYVGNGLAVEWRGFSYGCVETELSKRPWTHWYAFPFLDYGDAQFSMPKEDRVLGDRLLKKGCSGNDVKALQELLIHFGYSVGRTGVDGIFGVNTENGLKSFQKKMNLVPDGKYGRQTHAAMMMLQR